VAQVGRRTAANRRCLYYSTILTTRTMKARQWPSCRRHGIGYPRPPGEGQSCGSLGLRLRRLAVGSLSPLHRLRAGARLRRRCSASKGGESRASKQRRRARRPRSAPRPKCRSHSKNRLRAHSRSWRHPGRGLCAQLVDGVASGEPVGRVAALGQAGQIHHAHRRRHLDQ